MIKIHWVKFLKQLIHFLMRKELQYFTNQWDGAASEGAHHQVCIWSPDPHGRRWVPSPTSCSSTSIRVQWHTHAWAQFKVLKIKYLRAEEIANKNTVQARGSEFSSTASAVTPALWRWRQEDGQGLKASSLTSMRNSVSREHGEWENRTPTIFLCPHEGIGIPHTNTSFDVFN